MKAVQVLPYSPQWPVMFAATRDLLLRVFAGEDTTIEHIGSTAVPGLAAKPVIDVLLGAPSLDVIERHTAQLDRHGFDYVPRHERVLPQRRYFVAQPPSGLRVHLHGVVQDGELWRQHLSFRDALRRDPALRDRYQQLKLQLAIQHAGDKSAYTEAKGPFVRETLAALTRTPRSLDEPDRAG